MSLTRWQGEDEFIITAALAQTRVASLAGATTYEGDAIDLRDLGAGARHLAILNAFETNANNTGVTFAISQATTSAGTYVPATTSGSLAGTGAVSGTVTRKASILPDEDYPFIKITALAATTSDVDIHATLLSYTNP